MLKAEHQRSVSVPDTLHGWVGLMESLRVCLLCFSPTLDLGSTLWKMFPLAMEGLKPQSFQQHPDGFVLREYPVLREAHKDHPVQLSGVSLLSAPWHIQALRYCCSFCSLPFKVLQHLFPPTLCSLGFVYSP